MKSNLFFILLLLCISMGCSDPTSDTTTGFHYDIIPQVQELEKQEGHFKLDDITKIFIQPDVNEIRSFVAKQLSDYLKAAGVEKCPVNVAQNSTSKGIFLSINPNIEAREGYNLTVSRDKIELEAKQPKGLFYGIQTLRQLIQNGKIPAVAIKDAPRFPYRGMHLDVCRHFFPVEFVKKYIDQLAFHKINNFHWHLTEDQGWRIEIKQYPKLQSIASKRKETLIGHYSDQPQRYDGKEYGGYYTQEEVKEVIQYAKERFINIIPEIEMPGHSLAALSAYPELACTEGPFEAATKWGIFEDVYCPKEETFTFLENVLQEVMDLFPSKYIHIGGDECPKKRWEESAFCQQLIKKEGLKDEHELQSYFIQRIEKFVNSKGRIIIGWDEILEGGLAPNAVVMSWRGMKGGIAAAKEKHQVIMSPTTHCYFDYYQSKSEDEPIAIGGFTPLEKVYEFEPIPDELTPDEHQYILGAQANLWTEYIPTPEHAEYMVFPRLCALSEVIWSPKEKRSWDDFTKRLNTHLKRLDEMNINYAKHLFDVKADIKNEENGNLKIGLSKNAADYDIYYTLDGNEPTSNSTKYTAPIPLDKSSTLIAKTIHKTKDVNTNPFNLSFQKHLAVGKKISIAEAASDRYPGLQNATTLINGMDGGATFNAEQWLGFDGGNCHATIDLGEEKAISNVQIGTFKGNDAWIYLPSAIRVLASSDGKSFKEVKNLDRAAIESAGEDIAIAMNTNSQFLKVEIDNFGEIPAGKAGAGHKAWLFVDEIIVE